MKHLVYSTALSMAIDLESPQTKSFIKKLRIFVIHKAIVASWFFTRHPWSSARGMVIRDSQVLLVKNLWFMKWSFPGGSLKPGEDPKEGCLREVCEETGVCQVVATQKMGTYLDRNKNRKDTVHVFVMETQIKDIIKEWEIHDAQWFDVKNLPKNIDLGTKKRIIEYFSKKDPNNALDLPKWS